MCSTVLSSVLCDQRQHNVASGHEETISFVFEKSSHSRNTVAGRTMCVLSFRRYDTNNRDNENKN